MRSRSHTWQDVSGRSATASRLLPWQRVLLAFGSLLLLAIVTATTIVLYLTATERGRRSLANRLEDAVSREIPGSMEVGELERVGARLLTVRDLRFLKTNGEPVLTVAYAQIDADVTDLLTGEIAFERARVHGGHLIIALEPHGRTGLEEAFSARGPGDGDGGAELDMRAIHVQDLTLTVRPSPDEQFRMRDVAGFVAIAQHGPPGVRVRLDRISGVLEEPEFLGAKADIVRADGLIRGGVERVLDLELHADLGDDRVAAHLVYANRDRPPNVVLELEPGEGVRPRLVALAAQARTLFTDTVDVRVK